MDLIRVINMKRLDSFSRRLLLPSWEDLLLSQVVLYVRAETEEEGSRMVSDGKFVSVVVTLFYLKISSLTEYHHVEYRVLAQERGFVGWLALISYASRVLYLTMPSLEDREGYLLNQMR